jgi:hypothetical protein
MRQAKNAFRPVQHLLRYVFQERYREQERRDREYLRVFKKESAHLWEQAPAFPLSQQTILFVSSNLLESVKVEVALLTVLRTRGLRPVILTGRANRWVQEMFRSWGLNDFVFWEDHLPSLEKNASFAEFSTFHDVIAFEVDGMRVGKYVASWVMRRLRIGSFDPTDKATWSVLLAELQMAAGFASAAKQILNRVSPAKVFFIERGYSPWGQLFDLCMQQRIDVIQWLAAHRNNALLLKRYHAGNAHVHPSTLSVESWEIVRNLDWGESMTRAIQNELFANYQSGQWYAEVGTQFGKRMLDRAELQRRLNLKPDKKTAIIFPHLFWDATFFFGEDLFEDYRDWFVSTLRAAVLNPALNWVIKIHPANLVKNQRDGYKGESSEINAIRDEIDVLPDHVKLIPADSDISTFSLFSLMDYCLTVRGTIGIEAAMFGIPTLTAGTGRYDHLGFTIDSNSREEYVARLARLQDIAPLTYDQKELAQRFAYGVFRLRPFDLDSMTFAFSQDARASLGVDYRAKSISDLVASADLQGFADWVCRSSKEDWLSFRGLK